jgi:putative nucleotidyltransferase with HDIG domain
LSNEKNSRLEARPWSKIAEQVTGIAPAPREQRRARPVVAGVAAMAVAAAWSLGTWYSRSGGPLAIAVVLVGLGLAAEFLPYQGRSRGAVGSVAIIPFAAAIFVLPDVRSALMIGAAQIAVQVIHRRPPLKVVFNVSQWLLAAVFSVVTFRTVELSPGSIGGLSFVEGLRTSIVPAGAAFATMTLVNAICVTAIISLVQHQPFLRTLGSTLRPMPVLVGLQVVIAFYLAWLASHLGWLGAAGMVLPLLAVRQLSRTTIELTRVTEELLDLMVAAIEARDPYTSGHSRRVASAATQIAKAIGLKPEEVERVQVAALLHDVGKINEEFARILAKEGRLTAEEWEIMKRHPIRSAELVGLVSSLRDVVPAVRHHHENWDGTGYPDGRKGVDIPLASRIIMFADTLDAITTDRPYRRALDPEEAKKEFVKFRGRQFDPAICDAVVSKDVWEGLYLAARRSQLAHGSVAPAATVA